LLVVILQASLLLVHLLVRLSLLGIVSVGMVQNGMIWVTSKAQEEIKALKVFLVLKVLLVLKALKVLLDLLELRDLRVLRVLLVPKVRLVRLVQVSLA
jgi:hypothetical protein